MSRASAAGITFTNRTLKAGWAGRSGHTSVVDAVSGAIYVIGGIGSGSTLFQDVWASTDGGARRGYSGVLHGGAAGVLRRYLGGTKGTKGVVRGAKEY